MTAQSIWFLKNLLASILLPPFSLCLLAIAGLLLLKRKPKLGKSLVALSVALLFALSTPLVANRLMYLLEKNVRALPPGAAHAADAIVILGAGVYHDAPEYAADAVGGLTLERLQYGAYLRRQTGLPILVTGGGLAGETPEAVLMKYSLEQEFKVPVRWVEARSLDTAQNARFSAAILKAAGIRRVLVVSHAWHLPRARIAFEQQGITMIPAPTRFGFVQGEQDGGPKIFAVLPQPRALLKSYYALHEGIGIVWYKWSR